MDSLRRRLAGNFRFLADLVREGRAGFFRAVFFLAGFGLALDLRAVETLTFLEADFFSALGPARNGFRAATRFGALILARAWVSISIAGAAALVPGFFSAPGSSSRQPWASRTEIIADKMLFQVCGCCITALGNMQPSQQMCRIAL